MYILGVSCFYHDAAAALMQNGTLLCAAEEERFSRKKHDFGFPRQAINFCLESGGIGAGELDYVVFHEKPFRKFERIIKTVINTYPCSGGVFAEAMKNWFTEKLWIKNILREYLSIPSQKILFTEHHLAHAASAFFLSPFPEAAILTVDGVGEWATATVGIGKGNTITLLKQIKFPDSIGLLYSTFTAFLGFEVNEGEYKVMGMSSYGRPRFAEKIRKHLLHLNDDGSFSLNMDYFSYHYSTRRSFSRKFESLFGAPRDYNSHFFTRELPFPSYYGEKPRDYEKLCAENQYYADIAASIQEITEEIILRQARFVFEQTNSKNLCMAGGVSLNSRANGRILLEGPFDELFIQPAPGDSGAAIGAASYAYYTILKKPRQGALEHAYWGKQYSDAEIAVCLENKKANFRRCENSEELINTACKAIMQGEIVGWFQGRFEWGPRALGNRSILADPRNEKMKDIVNAKIKFREPFRPFAPVILEEELENYFETAKIAQQYPLRFMLLVLPIKEEKRKLIPAVDHFGTGRVQTIRREWNPLYYRLIERFGQKTGIPILLNTSFNVKGEPIVNSPENAYTTFVNSGLEMLIIGNFVLEKENNEKDR